MRSVEGGATKLVGIFLSPYVRGVAVSLHLLKLPFEFEESSANPISSGAPDIVRRTIAGIRVSAL